MTTLVPVRRTCCIRASRPVVDGILADFRDRGELLTPLADVRATVHADNELTATFDIRALRPAHLVDPADILPAPARVRRIPRAFVRALASAWRITALRRATYLGAVTGALFGVGYLTWLHLGDEITAGLELALKAAVGVVMLLGTVAIFRGDEVDRCTRRHSTTRG